MYFLNDSLDYLPSYMSLDPEHEMEDLSKNIIVRLYSGKNAILIYSRLLDCIEAHRSMLHHFRIDNPGLNRLVAYGTQHNQ